MFLHRLYKLINSYMLNKAEQFRKGLLFCFILQMEFYAATLYLILNYFIHWRRN